MDGFDGAHAAGDPTPDLAPTTGALKPMRRGCALQGPRANAARTGAMRAVRFHTHGSPDVLRIEEVERPVPGPSEVLIRVLAAGLNPLDLVIRSGTVPHLVAGNLPRGLGFDVAGVIEAVGENVDRLSAGDRVIALLNPMRGEAQAEFVTAPSDDVAAWPDALDANEAAGAPCAVLTAFAGLREKAGMRSGEHVLINGASGGVGHLAVQLAHHLGAEVTAVASGAHRDFCLGLGADHFIDYTEEDFAQRRAAYDIVFDVAGESDFGAANAALRERGRYVTTQVTPTTLARSVLQRLMPRKTASVLQVQPNGPILEVAGSLLSTGALRVHVGAQFPLERVASAHRRFAQEPPPGKTVLVVADE